MREPEASGSIAAMTMSMERILEQLNSLHENSASFASEKDADPIWSEDCTALEAAIAMIRALRDEGVNDAEALKDLIFDYDLAVKQNKENHRKFEIAAKAFKMDGVYHCPECNHRVAPNHSFCHWCGKRLGWR